MVHSSIPLCLCLTSCDPIQQDCPEGQACDLIQQIWTCRPGSAGDAGAYGDACYSDDCDPGLLCFAAHLAPPGLPCEGERGCCMELCDLDDPLGDLQCPGVASGEICQPLYQAGPAPSGYEHLGVCALPT
jgi:hypothetical protein